MEDALAQGKPDVLNRTTDRAEIRRNRREALRGQSAAGPGQSLDEYPFASCAQGGAGACVRPVPAGENHTQGGDLGAFYSRYNIRHGDPYRVRVVP